MFQPSLNVRMRALKRPARSLTIMTVLAAATFVGGSAAQEIVPIDSLSPPLQLAQAPAAPGVIGIGVRGYPATTHVSMQPLMPFAASTASRLSGSPNCRVGAESMEMKITPPTLPKLVLPTLSLPALCAAVPGSQLAALGTPGAPCPPESFVASSESCGFQGGESFMSRQSPWLWSNNAALGSIGLPVVLRVYWRK